MFDLINSIGELRSPFLSLVSCGINMEYEYSVVLWVRRSHAILLESVTRYLCFVSE